MKNVLVVLFLFACQAEIFSQEIPYTFQKTNEEFVELTDGISLNNDQVWAYDDYFSIDLPFDFKVGNQNCTSINVSGAGLEFVGLDFTKINIYHNPNRDKILEDKGTDVSLSPVTYKFDTISGNDVLKIEFKNAGFRQFVDNTVEEEDFVTFQIWLIENLNQIKIVFGPNESDLLNYADSHGPQGPFTKLFIQGIAITPFGSADDPSFKYEDCNIPCYGHITGTPSDGVVYNFFLVETTNVKEINKENVLNLYPNPIGDYAYLEIMDGVRNELKYIQLIDCNGVSRNFEYAIQKEALIISMKNKNPGLYFIRLFDMNNNILGSAKLLKVD